MTSIASKNLYDLLGNDPELDPDREPEPPTQAVDKPVARTGKRNAGAEGPVERAPDAGRPRGGGRGGRQENFQGSEQAFRDRGAGAYQNRSKPVDDGLRQDRHPDRLRRPDEHRDIGNRGRGSRGGRGGRGGFEGRGTRTGRNDRHPNRHNESDHDKQAAHGWGGNTGDAELADEKAGEALAKEDEKNEDAGPTQPTDGEGFTPDTGAGGDAEVWGAPAENGAAAAEEKEPEPEDNSKSYEAYLAELAEKKLALGSKLEIRKPNEGSNANFPEGQAFSRDPEEADYMKGEAQKKARERQKKEKNLLEIDGDLMRPQEPRSEGGRGGRGRGRGGFRGDREGGYRGDREGGFRGRGDREGGPRGEGGFRGDGRGRGRGRGRGDGEFRGSRGGPRGGPRGGAQGANLAVDDQTAFPSLGA